VVGSVFFGLQDLHTAKYIQLKIAIRDWFLNLHPVSNRLDRETPLSCDLSTREEEDMRGEQDKTDASCKLRSASSSLVERAMTARGKKLEGGRQSSKISTCGVNFHVESDSLGSG